MKITQLISAPQSIGGPIDGVVLLYNMSDCVEWEEVVDFPEDFWDDAGRLAALLNVKVKIPVLLVPSPKLYPKQVF